MSGIQQLLLGGSPAGGYQIERSLRFNRADGAYLNRTFGTPTDNKKWTFSAWIKVSDISSGINRTIFSGDANDGGTNFCFIRYNSLNQIDFRNMVSGVDKCFVNTTAVFRDPSAYFHLQFVFDSNNATQANRQILYINGTSVSLTGTLSTSSDACSLNVNGRGHRIGELQFSTSSFDGYMTEVNFIDGQALTPSSFGQSDPNTGVWSPIKYTGTYGSNGFFLSFSDNSNTTSTTLGKDSSGNGNNWTPNLFSVTAGAGNDSLVDTPTSYGVDTGAGGEVRGNYATWNPLDKDDGITSVTEGNLKVVTNGSNGSIKSTIAFPSGKWYWEVTSDSINASGTQAVGIMPQSQPPTNNMSDSGKLGYALDVSNTDRKFENGTATSYGTYTQANGAIYMLAFDQDAGKLWYGIDGTWLASGAPASGTNPSSSSIPTTTAYCAAVSDNTVSGTFTVNFGQRAFSYTAPSGFKALCTQNLPTPTIGATSTTQAGKYFGINLWTGNGSTGSRAITGLGFKPDWVWWKNRTTAKWHQVFDSNRGADKALSTNATDAEDASGGYGGEGSVTSFDSDGYTLQGGVGNNENGSAIVGWAWQAGQGTNSTNTSGSITSTVSANTTAGFSIVTYTGTGANATVGHGLGVAPSMVIYKNRDALQNWMVATTVIDGSNDYLFLNTTAAKGDSADSAPTSTLLNLTTYGHNNGASQKIVAYCFAPVAGYSAFGSYTGNGSSDGPFVYTGFRPRYVMVKRTNSTGNWIVEDTSRSPYNQMDAYISANASSAEATGAYYVDYLSNGFKLRYADPYGDTNASGSTYIFAAFAESPFKYSLAR